MKYRVIIAGSRTFQDYELLKKECDDFLKSKCQTHEIVIVSGAAQGADRLGEQYARERGYAIDSHPADWKKYGKAAGPFRNAEMVNSADALIAFWDGKSRGTEHIIRFSQTKGRETKIVRYESNTPPSE